MNNKHLTAEEQLDVLWKALQSPDYWMSVRMDGSLALVENLCESTGHRIGATMHCYNGSRRSAIEQLHAKQIGEVLDDPSPVSPTARPGDTFDLGDKDGYF